MSIYISKQYHLPVFYVFLIIALSYLELKFNQVLSKQLRGVYLEVSLKLNTHYPNNEIPLWKRGENKDRLVL